MSDVVAQGDRILLFEPETGRRWLVHLDGEGARKYKGLGVFDPARLEGMQVGQAADVGGKRLHVLRPTLPDLHATVRRKAQIITAKDAARILWGLGVRAGDRVFESGVGSGAATLALAEAVGPEGEVVVQELRDDFAQWAKANLEAAGLGDRVRLVLGDLTQGLASDATGPFDAVLLDQPEPWLAVEHLLPALKPGARLAAYCPQVVQLEQTAHALRGAGFAGVEAMEIIERAWEVKERGSRPAFDGLGHTGFLVFARWLGGGPDA